MSGLVFGLLVWLVAYLTMPTLLPQLLVITAPAFIIQHVAYGTLTGLVLAKLRPQPYALTDERRAADA